MNTIVEPIITPIRYIDLFCGLGAFHTAFNSSSRFRCVLACDIDDGARRLYKANYGLEPVGDIRNITIESIPDFDILCAGFPCQPFSIAGLGEGFSDKVKGNLFYDILKIIDGKRPKMVILENVKNLMTHDNGNTYKTIEKELLKRGFALSAKVLNAVKFGSPQARERIFIVGTIGGKGFVIPDGNPNAINTVSTIIDKTVNVEDLDRNRYVLKPVVNTRAKPQGKPNILFNLFPKVNGEKKTRLDTAKAALLAQGGDPNTLDKGGRQGERVYSIDAVGVTICASSGGPGAKTGLYKVGEKIRRLTVKEGLRMFGFPEGFAFPDTGSEDALYYLGNSIVVNVPLAFVPQIVGWFDSL